MKEVYHILSELKKLGGRLYVEDGKLNLDIQNGKLTSDLAEKIKYRRDDIIAFIGNTANANEYVPIQKVPHRVSYPVSGAQRRLWVISQLEQGSSAYNAGQRAHLERGLDIECFKKAVYAAVDRHEILRTVFKEDETGELRQWVLNRADLNFEIDYRDFRNESNKMELVQAYCDGDVYKVYDLENGPVIRAALLQVEDDEYSFYYGKHHIISDGWSQEVLARDVFAFYAAFIENREPELPELRIQFKDYAAWQIAQIEGGAYDSHKTYWMDLLSGPLPSLHLYSFKRRPKVRSYNGDSIATYLHKDARLLLKNYSENQGGTLFMGFVAVWSALMYCFTDQKDIVLGTSVAGRDHADLKDQIGFYTNTLVLRNEVKPEEGYNELFERIKKSTFKSYQYQMYPFDQILKELEIQRENGVGNLFEVMLVLQNNRQNTYDFEVPTELRDKIINGNSKTSKFDLLVDLEERGEYLFLMIEFDTDIYDQDQIERLIADFNSLVRILNENPTRKISQINLLSENDREQLLNSFNDTEVSYPKATSLLDLFEEQVANSPESCAIQGTDLSLTYSELDALSNQLAHCLRENYGLKSGYLAGIKLDRSEWSVISMLAVLKTGAAYVPIDPSYPTSRKAHILAESNIQVLITNTDYLFDEEQFEGSIFAVDVEFDKDQYSKDRINEVESAESLAYVIYTSGSTGKPKGVMIDHHSLLNYLSWGQGYYSNNGAIALNFGLFTSTSFDLTITSLYLPLISGGTLHVFAGSTEIGVLLKDYFQRDISCIKLTPAHISLLGNMDIESTAIAVAIVGGDSLNASHIKILRGLNPHIRIYNEYGPTEATVGCITAEIESENEAILIGKPIANTQIYLLNDEHSIRPIGVIGEICIGGDGLAQGYLNQEALTQEKFVANPFKAGQLMYKTGDLARWLPDGSIEFLGRKDDQVKIRGYRIELGEIEHALLQRESIDAAVVLAKEDESGEQVLVAYLTSKGEQHVGDVRSHLQAILPEYMIPTHYVQLEELPLTSNGKVDKKSLPNPAGLGLATGAAYVAPRNEIEESLVKIWEEVLQREHIGIEDDFFALGGQSLKGVQLISRIQKEFDIKIDVSKIFQLATIRQIGEFISIISRNNMEAETDVEEFKI